MSIIIFVMILTFITKEIYCIDFCYFKCDNGKIHTLCSDCKTQEPCKSYTEQAPLTTEEKQYILDIHNQLRNKVAMGEQVGYPTASDMKSLSWDDEIANTASCWANACQFVHDCADVPDKYTVGQNLAKKGLSGPERDKYIKGKEVLKDMVNAWYDEVTKYDYKYTTSFDVTKAVHFTQLIWAETEFIGCEKIFYDDGSMLKVHLVCNYAPAGNIVESPLYVTGEPCSACECGTEYPALCGEPKKLTAKGGRLNVACNLLLITLAIFVIY